MLLPTLNLYVFIVVWCNLSKTKRSVLRGQRRETSFLSDEGPTLKTLDFT